MVTAAADSAATYANTAVKISVLTNDTGSSLTILSVTTPAHGTAKINTDKTITYTPATGYTGSDSFSYTIRDSAGRKATGTVSVTVRDRPPVAGADSAATDANTPVRIIVLVNDNDPDGHALSVSAVTQPANGAAVINTDKTITYTPKAAYTGADGFTYTVSDGRGGTAVGKVSVTVRNRAPVALPEAASTNANQSVAIPVLANDNDPDGQPLTISAVGMPTSGSAVANADGTIVYAPAPGFVGSDGFAYTVSDGQGWAATATVTVQVNALTSGEPFSDSTFFTDWTGWMPPAVA
jgi:hypothetical protein